MSNALRRLFGVCRALPRQRRVWLLGRELCALSVYSPYTVTPAGVRPRPPTLFRIRALHGIIKFLCFTLTLLSAFQQQLTSLVEQFLSELPDVDDEVKGRQVQLLSMMLADMSDPTDMLVAKLNCETKCEW